MIRVYDFKCEHCEIKFEKKVDYQDILKVKCPTCHRSAKKVVLSPAPVKFLGEGWYSVDNIRKNNEK